MASGASGATAPPPLQVREARGRDIGALARLYRSQDAASRRLHHPYPFDPVGSRLLFAAMVLSRGLRPWLLRHRASWAFQVLVAEEVPARRLVGYGTARFLHDARGPYARFGFLVAAERQGRGVGTAIALALYRGALDLGVGRGGGVISADNRVSRHVIEGLGFRLQAPTRPSSDGVATVEGLEDLREILARAATRAAPDLAPSG